MSDEINIPKVSMEDKKKALQNAIFHFNQPFYGALLQELTIQYTDQIETGAIGFNPKTESYEIVLNPNYFINHLDGAQRVSLLNHEIMHFTNKHLFRLPWLEASQEDKSIMNVAGDMSINQYIPNIPKGCGKCPHETYQHFIDAKCPGTWVDVKDFKLDDGGAFPPFKTLEDYFELIKSEQKKQKRNKNTIGNVNEKLGKLHHTDEHQWERLDEESKRKMLEEAKKIIKRTIEKTSHSHTAVPQSIQDLLQEIETMAAGINYKQILRNAIKKSASVTDREHTWTRPNRRYGIVSPGTKLGKLPVLSFYNDSSGSISVTEQNEYFRVMEGFLQVGSRKCMLSFWHTSMYYKKPYKKGQTIAPEDLQSGGTDVACVLADIKTSKPNLSIILTDGYYDTCSIKPNAEIIWIISKGGNKEHPMKHIGKTIMLEHLAEKQ